MSIEHKSFQDILRDRLKRCKTTDEKFDALIDIYASQTKLLDIIINSLSPEKQKEILTKAGFKELIFN